MTDLEKLHDEFLKADTLNNNLRRVGEALRKLGHAILCSFGLHEWEIGKAKLFRWVILIQKCKRCHKLKILTAVEEK